MSLNLVNSLFLNEEHARLDEEVLKFDFIDSSNFSLAVPLVSVNDEQGAATRKSWTYEYAGGAENALWDYITSHFGPENSTIYANYAPVIQSSGMGKSRMVDQLGKEHFIIPINLMRARDTGFPCADHAARDFLTGGTTQAEAYHRACLFIQALFKYTNELLQEGSFGRHGSAARVAQRFRELMTAGQEMGKPNQFREKFYYTVVRHAESLGLKKAEADPHDELSPAAALTQLVETLRAVQGQKSPTGNASEDKFPLIIIAFDEAHTLIDEHPKDDYKTWSHFGELQAVLQSLRKLPLFSLFVSTAAKISQLMPREHGDSQCHPLKPIEPFSDLGLDTVAKKVSLHWDHKLTLEDITGDAHIVSLGRPLFGTCFVGGTEAIRDDIIMFATTKLLNDIPNPPKLTDEQALACLLQHLPMKINPTRYSTASEQVERHMRVCMHIDPSEKCMVTVSASEPILSEAAYSVMARNIFDPPGAMILLLEDLAIERGDRGEFVALLLLTLARDQAVGPPPGFGRPEKRYFKMAPFLYGNLIKPSGCLVGLSASVLQRLNVDFPAAEMHFTHYVKLDGLNAVDRESLLLLMTRGAGVLCGSNPCSIDAINVFTLKGTTISLDNFGLILYQMGLDSEYSTSDQESAFDVMDPYNFGILEPKDPAVPLVRIFFALAAEEPSLTVRRREPTPAYGAIVYDIWCGGLSEELFAPIEKPATWSALLRASSKCDTIGQSLKYQGIGDFWR